MSFQTFYFWTNCSLKNGVKMFSLEMFWLGSCQQFKIFMLLKFSDYWLSKNKISNKANLADLWSSKREMIMLVKIKLSSKEEKVQTWLVVLIKSWQKQKIWTDTSGLSYVKFWRIWLLVLSKKPKITRWLMSCSLQTELVSKISEKLYRTSGSIMEFETRWIQVNFCTRSWGGWWA